MPKPITAHHYEHQHRLLQGAWPYVLKGAWPILNVQTRENLALDSTRYSFESGANSDSSHESPE